MQEGCLSYSAAAVDHDELGLIRTPGPLQEGQLSLLDLRTVCAPILFVWTWPHDRLHIWEEKDPHLLSNQKISLTDCLQIFRSLCFMFRKLKCRVEILS